MAIQGSRRRVRQQFRTSLLNIISFKAVCIFLVAATLTRVTATPASDKQILEEFKAGISNSDVLGWTASDPCSWNSKMVVCDNSGNVLQLRVRAQGLTGTVTSDINKLASLQYLELNYNSFTGAMPSLAGLSNLQYAFLNDNQFDTIPSDFFNGLSSIIELWLDNNNQLNKSAGGWTIPSDLQDAVTLTLLAVNNVSATGSIPSFLSSMASLTTFRAAYNSFTGGLPASFGNSNIQILWLNDQALNGSISVVGSMAGLTQLWLHGNQFTGPVPDGLASAAGLTTLRLSSNQLVGRLPLGLASLESLNDVWLNNNYFDGELPDLNTTNYDTNTFCGGKGVQCSTKVTELLDFLEAAGYPQNVAKTWIGSDPCTASPTWTGVSCDSAGNVVTITLSNHGLTGNISSSLANLTSLVTLILSGNSLSGSIPQDLAELTSLMTVDVRNNNLSGPLPSFSSSVKFYYSGNSLLDGTSSPASAPVPPPPPPPQTPPPPPPVSAPVGGAPPTETPPSPPPVSTPVAEVPITGSPSAAISSGNSSSPAPVESIAPNSPAPISNASAVNSSGVLSPESTPRAATGGGKSKTATFAPVLGGVLGGAGLCVLAAFLVYFCYNRYRNDSIQMLVHSSKTDLEVGKVVIDRGSSGSNDDGQAPEMGNMAFTIEALQAVTNNFSEQNILGRGGFGVVYRGELEDGRQIAVKRMEAAVVSSKGLSEFESEIAVLTKVKHRHLVDLLGYCTDGIERLLVYEYMSQGTLAQHLFRYNELEEKPLTWKMRLTIALDVAHALEYLHALAHQSFIHRDLKPSNILLTDDFRAKVSDFGLVKLAPEGKFSVETRLAGTFGYLAPEYAVTGRVTTKVDVFSFGVVLMEIITGRRAVDETQEEENMYLVTWFTQMKSTPDSFRSTIDSNLNSDEESFESILAVAELAGHCTAPEPSRRPDMGQIVNILGPLVAQWKPMDTEMECRAEDTDLTLPEMVKHWQAFEEDIVTEDSDDSKASLPTRPAGFADTFTSADGR